MNHKRSIPLGLLLCILFSHTLAQNSIQGKVNIPHEKKKLLGKNTNYTEEKVPSLSLNEEPLLDPDRNAIISLHPLDFSPPLPESRNARITQKKQRFIPMVLPVTRGSTIYLINEDDEFHNVYSRTPKASFNIGRRPPGNIYPQKIRKTGVVKLFCDIHAHMNAVILSLDTPFFTRLDANSSYYLDGLPDGSYEIRVYHPEGFSFRTTIALSNKEKKVLNFELKP